MELFLTKSLGQPSWPRREAWKEANSMEKGNQTSYSKPNILLVWEKVYID